MIRPSVREQQVRLAQAVQPEMLARFARVLLEPSARQVLPELLVQVPLARSAQRQPA
jgi:hypothetical protein